MPRNEDTWHTPAAQQATTPALGLRGTFSRHGGRMYQSKKIWYFRAGDAGDTDPDYSSWMVEYEDGEFDDEDYLVIRHLKAEKVIEQLNKQLNTEGQRP